MSAKKLSFSLVFNQSRVLVLKLTREDKTIHHRSVCYPSP